MNPSRYFGLSLALLAALLLTAAGCKSGPAMGEVQGKVTFNGKPLTSGGKITFYNPKTGDPAEADLEPTGAYVIAAPLPVGDYIVWITPPMHLVDTDPGKTPPSLEEKPVKEIPPKYRNQVTTTLKTTIKEGKNEANFDMLP